MGRLGRRAEGLPQLLVKRLRLGIQSLQLPQILFCQRHEVLDPRELSASGDCAFAGALQPSGQIAILLGQLAVTPQQQGQMRVPPAVELLELSQNAGRAFQTPLGVLLLAEEGAVGRLQRSQAVLFGSDFGLESFDKPPSSFERFTGSLLALGQRPVFLTEGFQARFEFRFTELKLLERCCRGAELVLKRCRRTDSLERSRRQLGGGARSRRFRRSRYRGTRAGNRFAPEALNLPLQGLVVGLEPLEFGRGRR